MTLTELYTQQQSEQEQFNKIRQEVWDKLQQDQQGFIAAFGGNERLPDDIRKKMDSQIAAYHHEWANDTGQRYQDLQRNHLEQRKNIPGYIPDGAYQTNNPNEISPAEHNAKKMDNRQEQMKQQIATAQPVIEKRAEQPKEQYVSAEQFQELQKVIAQQQAIRRKNEEKKTQALRNQNK